MASHRILAEWYYQLGAALEAGLPLPRALDTVRVLSSARRRELQERLRAGESFEQILATGPDWMPEPDRLMLAGGVVSGRLPEVLKRLAKFRQGAARSVRRMLAALAYPVLLLHAAALLLPAATLVTDGTLAYGASVGRFLGPFWAVAILGWLVLRWFPRLRWALVNLLPGIAGWSRARDRALLAFLLEGFYAAGIPPSEAWPRAGRATGNPFFTRLGEAAGQAAREGRRPGEVLEERPAPGDLFVRSYIQAEESGKLEESLGWLADHYEEEAGRKLLLAATLYPTILYMMIVLWIAIRIVLAFAAYFQGIDSFFE
ncbi:MAG: hypothetical protein EA425_14630 [Puniceicoccaceae bacterium]|nr:MAG: hypothetical protein EA425_14630 [Puniceicoccaceae bacterium]